MIGAGSKMPESHKIQCRCGQLRGILKPTASNRCVCYCADCQAFARSLAVADVLDEFGGTEIIQVPASQLVFTDGLSHLACLKLTEVGMLRWYAACCRTPIGNTPANRKVSFVGLIHSCLRAEGQSLDASFGPVTMRCSVSSALGDEPPAAMGLFRGIAKVMGMIIGSRLSGAYLASPFFHAKTGAPIAVPRVLSPGELKAARNTG